MTHAIPLLPHGCTVVEEVPVPDLPAVTHPDWADLFPWLIQGTTTRGDPGQPFDLGLFSDASAASTVMEGWRRLRQWSGMERVVHAKQVHRAEVRRHGPGSPGLHLADACDRHATDVAGVMLTVTTADCVPVFVVAPRRRWVALLHAGWRGAAAGILEHGLEMASGGEPGADAGVHVHLGPAICGECYEVGPEVFQGLGMEVPAGAPLLDLRAALAIRARDAGVRPERITVSSHCTRCGTADLFSHRGGDRARQVGYLGLRR